MKIIFKAGEYFVEFNEAEYLDPEIYETHENDPINEREEARINRIVWGKKIYLKPVIIEGTYTKGE